MKVTYDNFLKFLSERYGETSENIKEVNSFSELGLDSLSLFSLIEDIEKEYNVQLDVEDLTDIDTVEKMYGFISEQLK